MPFIHEVDLATSVVKASMMTPNPIRIQDIISVQKLIFYEPMWILGCPSTTVKNRILTLRSIQIEQQAYELLDFQRETIRYDSNSDCRLSLHGFPFTVSDAEIENWVDRWAIRSSRIMKAKAKATDGRSRKHESLLNGNRFYYISDVISPCPRFSVYQIQAPNDDSIIIDVQIQIFYPGQTINCRKCLADDHTAKDCKQTTSRNKNLIVFRGGQNPLSNFFPVQLESGSKSFPSSEHWYQYRKAMYVGDTVAAGSILDARTPYDAMLLGRDLNTENSEWEAHKTNIMREILQCKYDQCPEFQDSLQKSETKILAEATSHLYWASGLPPSTTSSRACETWPGRNMLGKLLMELRAHQINADSSSVSEDELGQSEVFSINTPAVNNSEVIDVVNSLLAKATPQVGDSCNSPELFQRADDIITQSMTKNELRQLQTQELERNPWLPPLFPNQGRRESENRPAQLAMMTTLSGNRRSRSARYSLNKKEFSLSVAIQSLPED